MNNQVQSVLTLLKVTFGVLPIVVGLDKFFDITTDWSAYLAPSVVNILPVEAGVFMMIVGVIEIIAGILVLTKWTTVGAYIVSAWLALISINLLVAGIYDVAVRDIVLAISAFALARLSAGRQELDQIQSQSATV